LKVKGGGHTGNKGFSSTPGVQISMAKFKQVVYNDENQTAEIGAGCIWDEVYAGMISFLSYRRAKAVFIAALQSKGVNVVGGRVSGVGVGGFTLGGGM
jgi:FAD/FMN-containing dehydrogenase